MVSVTHFAQYLLKLDPQKNVARLALYHYLKNICDINAELQPEMIRSFYSRILNFPYWQSNHKTLGEVVANDLENFLMESHLKWDLSQIRHAHQVQWVEIKQADDFKALIQDECSKVCKAGDRSKVIPISDTQMLALILFATGNMRIQVFSNVAMVEGAKLKPLMPLTHLEYDSKMDLQMHFDHLLEGPMLTLNRFQVTDDGVRGWILRGYTLQKYETLNGGTLAQNPELFYTLKRIEKHYINPQSDPFYLELVGILEKAYQLLSQGHHDAPRMGEAALQRGKQALKNIFPNDKLLLLLVSNIEYYLFSKNESRPTEWKAPN